MTFTKKMALNKIDVVSELSQSNITSLLFMVESLENNKLAIEMARQLSKGKICYVSLHKTADALREQLEKNKVNTKNMVFVDGITNVIGLPAKESDKIKFITSPGDLAELSFVVFHIINRPCDYLIFDSLSDLLPYAKVPEIKEFMTNLINKVRDKKMKSIFYIKNSQNLAGFIEEIEPLVNGVVNADVI
ncbi:MAG: hypothetical protein WCK90_00690 [archaeon]